MKKIIFVLLCTVTAFATSSFAHEETQLPSETYYEDHIEAETPLAEPPSLRAGDDDIDPGGSTEGEGGWVGSPISDNAAPILAMAAAYVLIVSRRKRKEKNST